MNNWTAQRRRFRFTGTAVALIGLIAVAVVQGPAPDRMAEAQGNTCHYTQTPGGTRDLTMKQQQVTTWAQGDTYSFTFGGPYTGPVTISSSAGIEANAHQNFSCGSGSQTITVQKGAGPGEVHMRRCDEQQNQIQFTTRVNACGGQSTATYKWSLAAAIATEDIEPPAQPSQPSQSTAPAPVYQVPETLVLDKNSPGCAATGQLKSSLAVAYVMGEELGPSMLNIWWQGPSEAVTYCVRIRHADPATVPDGVSGFPEAGWNATAHESWRSMQTYGAEIGGPDFPGFYPGGSFVVSVQGIDAAGDYGPAASRTLQTHDQAELGAVRSARAYEPAYATTGSVTVEWRAAPGQPQQLQEQHTDDAIVEWHEDGGSYSTNQTVGMHYYGEFTTRPPFQAFPPQLKPDTLYHFRITPTRTNMPNGDPVEVSYRTRAFGPATITISRVDVDGMVWMRTYVRASRGVDQLLMRVRLEDDQVREHTLDGGGSDWMATTPLPPPGESCVSVAGVVGTGDDAVTGPWSAETCANRDEPDDMAGRSLNSILEVWPETPVDRIVVYTPAQTSYPSEARRWVGNLIRENSGKRTGLSGLGGLGQHLRTVGRAASPVPPQCRCRRVYCWTITLTATEHHE